METITAAVQVDEDLASAADVATLQGPQAQGDLLVLPWPDSVAPTVRNTDMAAALPIPTGGTVVLTGNGGHHHKLACTPGVAWHAYRDGQTLGVLTVADGALAVLGHEEHGDTHIGAGVYVIRRQREQADEIRMVAD